MMDRYQYPCRTLNFKQFTLLFALLLNSTVSLAEIVKLEMEKGLIATADYLPGDTDKPVILILHGFLQTRDFITIQQLASSLYERGYSLLLPNLTLGINGRNNSLTCEAIHTHSMDQDIKEISRWVHWAAHESQKKLVVIGQGKGSLQLTAYLSSHPDAPVDQSIFISLIPFGQGPIARETLEESSRADHDLSHDPGSLNEYGLVYCKRYLTTAGNYLSYVMWDQATTLEALSRIHTPIGIILGGDDQRLDSSWNQQLQQLDIQLIQMVGVNHFYAREYEIDLLESLKKLLD